MKPGPLQHQPLKALFEDWIITSSGKPLVVLPGLTANGKSASYALAGIAPEIVIWVSDQISVAALRGGDYFDLLAEFEVWPEQESEGKWKCGYPDCTGPSGLPSVAALVQAHVFDALALWVANTLHPAKWLNLYGSAGMTYARLEKELGPATPSLLACFKVHVHELDAGPY